MCVCKKKINNRTDIKSKLCANIINMLYRKQYLSIWKNVETELKCNCLT